MFTLHKNKIQGEEVDIRFSPGWTLGNIFLNILFGFVLLIWSGLYLYLIIILIGTLGTIIFLCLDSASCFACPPALQLAVLRPADPLTEFVLVQDNCGKHSVVLLQQWMEMDEESWKNMELHDYSDDYDTEIEAQVISELQHR